MNDSTVELTGEQLLAARKILKAAMPKKKMQDKAVTAIRVTMDLVEFVIQALQPARQQRPPVLSLRRCPGASSMSS